MYHPALVLLARHFLLIIVTLTSLCITAAGAGASETAGVNSSKVEKAENGQISGSSDEIPRTTVAVAASDSYPVLPAPSKLGKRPTQPTIYQLDNVPLSGRHPLLLVHGLRGEYRGDFRWGKVIKRFCTYPDFNRNYKIYLARYDSTSPLSKTLPDFKKAVLGLRDACGGQQVSIMALSLGGSLVGEAMQDPDVDEAVRLVFALATPFHGSPLFCADWFQFSLYKNLSYPWTRIDHSLAYRLYFDRNQNLLNDLRWDNSDKFIPTVGNFHSHMPFGPSGDLTVSRDANVRLAGLNTNRKVNKNKFITYAGYLLNPYLLPTIKRQLEITILAPYTFITVMLPAHLAREHPVLTMLNHEISRVIPDADAPHVANYPHVYALNDGITPVNSALFLPPEACKNHPLSGEAEILKVKDQVDVRLARVFRNIDHLTFVDGYRPNYGSHLLRDELNPEDGRRTIFDWMLSDLMQSETEQLAKEGSDIAKD